MNYVKSLTLAALFAVSGSVLASGGDLGGGKGPDAPSYWAQFTNLFGVRHAIAGGAATKEYVETHVKTTLAALGVAAYLGHRYNNWFRNNVSNPVINETLATAQGIRNGEGKSIAKGAGVVAAAALIYKREAVKTYVASFLPDGKKK